MRARTVFLALLAWLALATTPSCVLEAVEGAEVELLVEARVPVELERASLHIADARLRRCDAPEGRAWWTPAVAYAHHGTPTAGLDAPHAVTLAAAPESVGTMRPEAGEYCAIELELAPSETGTTFAAEGSIDGAPLATAIAANALWEIPLEASLVLDEASPWARVHVELDLDAALAQAREASEPDLALYRALEAHLRAWAEPAS